MASVAGYFVGMVALGPYAFGEEVFPVETAGDIWVKDVVTDEDS